MNNKIAILVGSILAAIVLATGGYYLGTRQADRASSDERIDPATGRRVLYWHDPMVPGHRFDKPGKSPFMDMELVPVYADEATNDAGVTLDPRVQQRLGVRTAFVERRSLTPILTAVGNVEYDERIVAVVQARAAGFVERVHARTPLQRVKAGEPLADVYVPEWVAAQEEFLAVQRMQSAARASLLAAARQRMRLAGMTDEHIDAVAKHDAIQARVTLRAPINGVISELLAREGMTVMSGAPLFRINGLDTVWVYAEIPEVQLARLRPGVGVTTFAAAYADIPLAGTVRALLPAVNATTRTAKARIELKNERQLLVPGMFVTVRIEMPQTAPVLVVPSEALIVTGERTIAILTDEQGRFRPVTVVTGVESAGQTEVRSGLEEGQRVVTSAQFLIDSEASLKATIERMSAAEPSETRDAGRETREESPSPQPSPMKGHEAKQKQDTPSPPVGEGRGEGAHENHGAHK